MTIVTIIAGFATVALVFSAGFLLGAGWGGRRRDEEERRLDDLEDEEEFLAGLETKYATQH